MGAGHQVATRRLAIGTWVWSKGARLVCALLAHLMFDEETSLALDQLTGSVSLRVHFDSVGK